MKDAWDFAQVDEFLARFSPLTPAGRDAAAEKPVSTDKAGIERVYDDTDAVLGFLESASTDPVTLERVSWHLKRIPRVPEDAKDAYELSELFQFKKFLSNHRMIHALLPESARVAFGIAPACRELAAKLESGGSDPETFFLAASYSPDLSRARAALSAADDGIAGARAALEERALTEGGLRFEGREFLVVRKESAAALRRPQGLFAFEPYDDESYTVRILPDPGLLELLSARERLREDERAAEEEVIREISAIAGKALPELARAAAALTRFDLARARALLAREERLVRPVLDGPDFALSGGRFVPCADECSRLGLAYTPLDAVFKAGAAVIFGSNMGGKTVALKTALFFQLLAQAGFFVPAKSFRTRVYDRIEYVGELAGERLAGLSGFGFEIWRFLKVSDAPGSAFVAFDEFARTTGSHEAEALLSAIVEGYAAPVPGGSFSRALFSTHFRGVARSGGAEYLRMKGLDRTAVSGVGAPVAPPDGLPEPAGSGLERRLSEINAHMRYELESDDGSTRASDALAVAEMLGLPAATVERARRALAAGLPGGREASSDETRTP